LSDQTPTLHPAWKIFALGVAKILICSSLFHTNCSNPFSLKSCNAIRVLIILPRPENFWSMKSFTVGQKSLSSYVIVGLNDSSLTMQNSIWSTNSYSRRATLMYVPHDLNASMLSLMAEGVPVQSKTTSTSLPFVYTRPVP
jgi:hypothetical protein